MAGIVQLKRSSVSGKVPDAANVEIGEPVVNFADRVIYTKNTTGTVIVIGAGTTSNVTEGSNLYFTNARAVSAFTEGSGINIDANGLISSTVVASGTFTFSATPPSSPSAGDRWVDSDDGIEYVYIDDGTSSQWVDLNSNFGIPDQSGNSGKYLTTDGSALSWGTVSSSGGGGGGSFNTNINRNVGYALTTTLATAVTMPSTANTRYILHSIHVTNIGTANVVFDAEISGTNYANISLANTIPLPTYSAVEILKKPKVLYPSDVVNMRCNAASNAHVVITYETVSTATHFGSGLDVTTALRDIHIANANSMVESILLVNDDGVYDVKANVIWTNASDTVQGYYAYNFIIPADASVEILEQPKYLESGHKIKVQATGNAQLEAFISGKTA